MVGLGRVVLFGSRLSLTAKPNKSLGPYSSMGKLLISTCLALTLAAPLSARGWRGIIPLHSTRADVESLLGKPLPDRDYLYQTEDHFVSVDYAKGPCEGWPSGWNVTANTVLSI